MNTLLSTAWEQYKNALSTGDTLEIEPKYETFVAAVLTDVIDVSVDAPA